MFNEKDFKPCLRFMVVSDIHYKDEPCIEEERFRDAIRIANRLAKEDKDYNRLDALYVVGDFANSGSEIQMKKIKQTIDENKLPETQAVLSMASHEYSQQNGGEEAAKERFAKIFDNPLDDHRVINGFHFISITTTNGCRFDEAKQKWAKEELEKAAADSRKKPVFFFQHPHITGTVYGSVYWGEDDLTPVLVNYPGIIDFSGHSHAPINDPRSVFQEHFTCLGTGTLSYFELDEFDKVYGTLPPEKAKAAQMLIVEADENGRVRVYPYDVLTDSRFPQVWKIDEPWNPDSFIYTFDRWKSTNAPYFPDGAKIRSEKSEDGKVKIIFTQAKDDVDYYPDDYIIAIKNTAGETVKKQVVWSEFYFTDMPAEMSAEFSDLIEGEEYSAEVTVRSFWKVAGKTQLKLDFKA